MLKKCLMWMVPLGLTACQLPQMHHVEPADLARIEQQLLDQNVDMLVLQEQNLELRTLLEGLDESLRQLTRRQAALASALTPTQARAATESNGTASASTKMVVGEIEPIFLADPNMIYRARIDSGAQTSSLDARNIARFERDGAAWVRFELPVPGSESDFVTVERRVVRTVRILQSSSAEAQRRLVVRMPFVLGSHRQTAEFTLTSRDNMRFPVLIGRNILRDIMLVDVGKENITRLPAEVLAEAKAGRP